VSKREGFQKVYDLPERVLPDCVDTRQPTLEEYADYLIDTTLRGHGFATQQSITYLRKGQKLRNAVGEQLAVRVDAGLLTRACLAGGSIAYLDPALLETRAPRTTQSCGGTNTIAIR